MICALRMARTGWKSCHNRMCLLAWSIFVNPPHATMHWASDSCLQARGKPHSVTPQWLRKHHFLHIMGKVDISFQFLLERNVFFPSVDVFRNVAEFFFRFLFVPPCEFVHAYVRVSAVAHVCMCVCAFVYLRRDVEAWRHLPSAWCVCALWSISMYVCVYACVYVYVNVCILSFECMVCACGSTKHACIDICK